MNLMWKAMLLFYKRHPFYWLLMLGSLATGVGVVVSIDSTIYSIFQALKLQDNYLKGKVTHSIISPTQNLPQSLYQNLKLTSGETIATPWLRGKVKWNDQNWNLIGIEVIQEIKFRNHWFNRNHDFQILDFLKQPHAAVIIQQKLPESQPDQIQILGVEKEHTLQVIGRISDSNLQQLEKTFLVDIPTAQTILNQHHQIQRIDLILKTQEEIDWISQWLQTQSGHFQLQAVENHFQESQALIAAFKMNLQALGLIVIMVGCFVILNTMYFLILKRQQILEIYYTLGATKSELLLLLLSEALLLGMMGSGLGIFLGKILSDLLIGQITQNINDHFFTVSVGQIDFNLLDLIKAYAIGILTTLVAVFLPAWDLEKKITGKIFSQDFQIKASSLNSRKWIATGALLFLLGFYLVSDSSLPLQWSILGFFFQLFGILLFFPTFSHLLFSMGQKYVQSSFWLKYLFANLLHSSTRIKILCLALILALATMIAVETMVSSFRKTFADVMEQTIQGDFYVAHRLAGTAFVLPEWVKRWVESESIKALATYFLTQTSYQGQNYPLYVYDILKGDSSSNHVKKYEPLLPKKTDFPQIQISEILQNQLNLEAGDVITLTTNQGEKDFFIKNVVYDYAHSQGLIVIDRKTYQQYWKNGQEKVHGFSLEWQENFQQPDFIAQLEKQLKNSQTLEWKDHQSIKKSALQIFDRTFAVTTVLKTIVVVVALIGMLSTYFLLQFEHLSTLGIFRVMGASPYQITGFMVLESLVLGGVIGMLSWIPGLWLSWILVDFINVKAFGWSFQWQMDIYILMQALALNLIATVGAIAIPSWYTSQSPPLHLVDHE